MSAKKATKYERKNYKKNKNTDDELRKEYDFSKMNRAVRGKFYQQYKKGTNIVHLDSDIVAAFKSEKSINDALISLLNIAKEQVIEVQK